jgi:hypothetical protein
MALPGCQSFGAAGRTTCIMIRTLLVLFVVSLLAMLALVAVVGVETTPLVEPDRRLSHDDLNRIKRLLGQHDPRRLRKQEVRTLSLTERDLNLILEYAAPYTQKTSSRVELYPGNMQVLVTVRLPDNPLGGYLNVIADLTSTGDSIHVVRLTLGGLALPGWLLDPLLQHGHRLMLKRFDEYRLAADAVSSFKVEDDSLIIVYQLDPGLVKRLQRSGNLLLFSEADRQRVLAYHDELLRAADLHTARNVSLSKVLPALFRLAAVRTIDSGDPQAENRALLLTLAMHAIGMNFSRFTDESVKRQVPKKYLSLRDRHDLAQHFLVSAALTVSTGSGLAGAMGIFKELDDSRGGSGYSFADLLADRAGIRLAKLATSTDQQAIRLQQRMSASLSESDFMPDIEDLPEGIMELEFKLRYHDLDSKRYRIVEEEIERRLSECSVYSAQDQLR